MTKKEALQLFEQRKVRTIWDDQEESGISLLWMCVAYLLIVKIH